MDVNVEAHEYVDAQSKHLGNMKDSNQDPKKNRIVYLVYKYDNNKEKKIRNPDSSKDFP